MLTGDKSVVIRERDGTLASTDNAWRLTSDHAD
jgi:hypothetical protein